MSIEKTNNSLFSAKNITSAGGIVLAIIIIVLLFRFLNASFDGLREDAVAKDDRQFQVQQETNEVIINNTKALEKLIIIINERIR